MSSPDGPCGSEALLSLLGWIDIYVLDQIMRGRITPSMRVLDAGCGGGRNSEYLMRCGAEVFGVDANAAEIDRIRRVAGKAAPTLPGTNFQVGRLSDLPFRDGYFDAVICSAVLHFAEDPAEFEAMTGEMVRVLTPGGVFFARLASTIGMEERLEPIADRERWHRMPDGTDRFLVDEAYLVRMTADLGGELLDPLKTTVVQDKRSMTTWVMRKS